MRNWLYDHGGNTSDCTWLFLRHASVPGNMTKQHHIDLQVLSMHLCPATATTPLTLLHRLLQCPEQICCCGTELIQH